MANTLGHTLIPVSAVTSAASAYDSCCFLHTCWPGACSAPKGSGLLLLGPASWMPATGRFPWEAPPTSSHSLSPCCLYFHTLHFCIQRQRGLPSPCWPSGVSGSSVGKASLTRGWSNPCLLPPGLHPWREWGQAPKPPPHLPLPPISIVLPPHSDYSVLLWVASEALPKPHSPRCTGRFDFYHLLADSLHALPYW